MPKKAKNVTDKKKSKPAVRKLPLDKPEPGKPVLDRETMAEILKRIKSIYSANGEYRAQLVNKKEGGWVCEIWSIGKNGDRDRPMLRNVQPFATMEEAIQMAQKCFSKFTGDDRYFAKDDIGKKNETE